MMDKLKASAFANMKKLSSLYELHSRLAAFQYQSQFLPYIKDILYPFLFSLRKKEFSWTAREELAWTQAVALATLNLRLTVPDPEDPLLLCTDASKVAASACLFRIKDEKLQLVSVTSKYFATVDLNKNSYTLEAISLAYALKTFSPYLLNCQSKVTIFTDAKSLIYCKRMSTHSILMNNAINYLTNFVSLINVELVHIPGGLNVLVFCLEPYLIN
jgi:RNase H-like domain found in reverse transcriptase